MIRFRPDARPRASSHEYSGPQGIKGYATAGRTAANVPKNSGLRVSNLALDRDKTGRIFAGSLAISFTKMQLDAFSHDGGDDGAEAQVGTDGNFERHVVFFFVCNKIEFA
jgi:hypothetical protein